MQMASDKCWQHQFQRSWGTMSNLVDTLNKRPSDDRGIRYFSIQLSSSFFISLKLYQTVLHNTPFSKKFHSIYWNLLIERLFIVNEKLGWIKLFNDQAIRYGTLELIGKKRVFSTVFLLMWKIKKHGGQINKSTRFFANARQIFTYLPRKLEIVEQTRNLFSQSFAFLISPSMKNTRFQSNHRQELYPPTFRVEFSSIRRPVFTTS